MLESFEVVLINLVAIFMISKTLVFRKKIFSNKSHDVVISAHDITNKILSHDANYFVDVAMWPIFGNSTISIEKVILVKGVLLVHVW